MLELWDSKKCYQFLLRISIIWVYFFKAAIFCFEDRLTDLTVHPRYHLWSAVSASIAMYL